MALETIFEQIPHVREKLREEANGIFVALSEEPQHAVLSLALPDDGGVAVAPAISEAIRRNLHSVYHAGILPFLRATESKESPLADPLKAKAFFDALRLQSPSEVHAALSDLEAICEEQRQLTRQSRLYYWLHGWLLVHVPVSVTLLVLGGIHALVALHY